MGWRNPPIPWRDLEARLSDRPLPRSGERPDGAGRDPGPGQHERAGAPVAGAGAPWRVPGAPRYAELHCHSNFSFLDGASHPEVLAAEAARLGLEALALTDHDGLYGAVRFAEAAREVGLPTVFGAELSLGVEAPANGVADPPGEHLVVLAEGPEGWARLARAIAAGQMAGSKGAPRYALEDLAGAHGGRWWVLTGCRKGAVPAELARRGPAAAATALGRLVEAFGRDRVAVELWDHGDPLDAVRNDALAEVAVRAGVDLVATTNAHYATPAARPLATALAAVRACRSLDEMDGWLPAGAGAHLRSGAEQARRFARYPGVVERAAELGRALAFDLSLVAPRLPPFPCPDGHTETTWLAELVRRGAAQRYPPLHPHHERARAQLAHELEVVETLGFAGYFLVVWDIVEFCRRADIYCQGRGSAANSAVCYALGITKADAVSLGLLFERFLSPERDGPPDIDLDIESGRREEVIQYVYERYGRTHAAQVANVITYRARSAVRDMGRALGHAPGQTDAWSRQLDAWGPVAATRAQRDPDGRPAHDIPDAVLDLAEQLEGFPRHLGIHSGGMVICDRPVVEVCPVEWARMEGRSVLQWDKDDCATVGLVKFDLLGLGMLTALHLAVDLLARHRGQAVDLATIPQEDAVYEMLSRGDSVGVFQVESRAQMATLPRLRPRCFYDLVVEVALIRPGPIQGGSVHPYIRRRNGREPVTYLHPLTEPALRKTLGVPLFQEQLMQLAIDVAGFTPAEADELRQAMGSKRSRGRMERLRARLYEGMAARGITPEVADAIYAKMAAFANYGFPESHSVSFAYLVYASAWLKLHEPAAFTAALLNAQPMGFWSPHTLVGDARRHGVTVRTPDVNVSGAAADLEPAGRDPTGGAGPAPGAPDPGVAPHDLAIRLGLASVRQVGRDLAERIVAERDAAGPYTGPDDLARRTGASLDALEALATAGAFDRCRRPDGRAFDRRSALWAAGAAAQARPGRLPGVVTGLVAPPLPGLGESEEAACDLWATGVAPGRHPTRFVRPALDRLGALTAVQLTTAEAGSRVLVGGVVTHRQRPATAGGTTFLNLEDETGLVNVVCSKGCWARHRRVVRSAAALLVRGRLERSEGVVNLVADRIETLAVGLTRPSRDFR